MVLAMSYLEVVFCGIIFEELSWPCSPFKPMAAHTEGAQMRRTSLMRSAAPVAAA